MSNFKHSDDLFEIQMDARHERISQTEAMKRIYQLLLSLDGRVTIEKGLLEYTFDEYGYLKYMPSDTGSLIQMSDKNSIRNSKSYIMNTLEEEQEQEIYLAQFACYSINRVLIRYPEEIRMLLMEQQINGLSVVKIAEKYHMSRRQVYRETKRLRIDIALSFHLTSLREEESRLRILKKGCDMMRDPENKKSCQAKVKESFELLEWQKQF